MGLWDVYQEIEIRQGRADKRLSDQIHDSRAETHRRDLERVDDRIDRLLIVAEAIWEIASEKLQTTDEELVAKVREIDARSGAVDGRRAVVVRRCGQCQAAIEKGRATCVFCGHPEPGLAAFDAV